MHPTTPAITPEETVAEKRKRLAEECVKLDPAIEKAMAEEGLTEMLEQ